MHSMETAPKRLSSLSIVVVEELVEVLAEGVVPGGVRVLWVERVDMTFW
jgi:hypothetical protein